MVSSNGKRRRNLVKAQHKKALKTAAKKELQFLRTLPQIREVIRACSAADEQVSTDCAEGRPPSFSVRAFRRRLATGEVVRHARGSHQL